MKFPHKIIGGGGQNIVISLLLENTDTHSQLILKSPHSPSHTFIISSDTPSILHTEARAIQQELDTYILKAHKQIQEKSIAEDYILEYLKHNPSHRQKLKSVFTYEVSNVLKNNPDVVAKWNFYQNFLQMD